MISIDEPASYIITERYGLAEMLTGLHSSGQRPVCLPQPNGLFIIVFQDDEPRTIADKDREIGCLRLQLKLAVNILEGNFPLLRTASTQVACQRRG